MEEPLIFAKVKQDSDDYISVENFHKIRCPYCQVILHRFHYELYNNNIKIIACPKCHSFLAKV